MLFVKQLVAFSIMSGAGKDILLRSRDRLEDSWILSSNAFEDELLLQPMTEEERALWRRWTEKWITPEPAAPESETVPAVDETAAGGLFCVNCREVLDIDPLTGMPEDRCHSCGRSSSKFEEPEPEVIIVCKGGCGRTTEGMTWETRVGDFLQVDESHVPEWTCPDCLAKREETAPGPGPGEESRETPEPEDLESVTSEAAKEPELGEVQQEAGEDLGPKKPQPVKQPVPKKGSRK